MKRIFIATSNPGKLCDFAGAARAHGVTIEALPGFESLPPVIEDGHTFEDNARKKAAQYSRSAPSEVVLADDSGLEVDALNGAPGVQSARYACLEGNDHTNSDDDANNARLLRELRTVPLAQRTGRFVCILVAASNGEILATFRGTVEGIILDSARGTYGFGYDPLFYFPPLRKTLAELTPVEKASVSHRGAAFRQFLDWCGRSL
jgi:XTP/dITP diphosphohydrolase